MINIEIAKFLEKNEKNNLNFSVSLDNKHIERDFLEFSSKINLYFYLSNDIQINEEEINYFCPEFCYMQDVIIICKTYNQLLEETLISFKYEILEKCYYRFEEYEIDKVFKNIYKDDETESAFESLKTYFLSNDICLMRIIKTGSRLEYNNILFDINKFFNSFELNNLDNNTNYFDNKYEFIKKNCFLINEPELIEYLFQIMNDQVYKIEGNIIINKSGSLEQSQKILKILKNCIKCTVGEEIRGEDEEFIGENDSIIHRYMQFYHLDYINEGKKGNRTYMESDYFMSCLNEYFNNYCKVIYNRTYGTKTVSKYYSEIIDPNNTASFREILINHFSFIIESVNLGFYEIRIPLMDYITKTGWPFIESDKFLLNKFYLYPENNFYKDLADKNNEKNILLYELPFDGLIYNINNYAELTGNNNLLLDMENSLTKYLGNDYMYKTQNNDNTEEIKNIIRFLIYKTKFESNKVFNYKSIMSDFKKTIVPRNYHYRIEPNKLYMDINRIYEVEEFTGLNFLEMVIQDYMKFRPIELNKTLDDIKKGDVLRKELNYRNRYEEKQFPLTPLLWGRKLNKICKIIENQKHNLDLCDNYGPIVFIPTKNKLSGIIRKDFLKDYEIYLYINLFEDIKTFINENREKFEEIMSEENRRDIAKKIGNGFDIKEMEDYLNILEKKLYEVFNSDIFEKTRSDNDNIKLVPNRIEPNNVRINKSLKSIERSEKKDYNKAYKNISSIKLDYEKKYHDVFKSSEDINEKVNYEIINKNVYLTDIFCFNGMKYHMYASLYFLINIIYKKINRQTELLSIYFDKQNKNLREINEEYDIIIDSLIKGFQSQSSVNYKQHNDTARYNAYLIEYFFYCLSEIKYYINEINYFFEKIRRIDFAVNSKFKGRFDKGIFDEYNEVIKGDHDEYIELMNIKENMEKILEENFKIINIILKESIVCPLQISEDELSDYINIYAPKERYYIPMFLNEKWERNLDNEKYKRLERVDKFLLNKLENLKENERNIFNNTGYELSNDYYLVEKNLLREPDPPISDKILLEKKKYDKTGFFKNFLRQKKGIGIAFGKNLINLNNKEIDKESSNSIQTINLSLGNNLENSLTSKQSSVNTNNINTINNNNFFGMFKKTNSGKKKKLFGSIFKNKIKKEKSEDSKVSGSN